MSWNGIPSTRPYTQCYGYMMEMSYITSTDEHMSHTHIMYVYTHLHAPLTVFNCLETIERK